MITPSTPSEATGTRRESSRASTSGCSPISRRICIPGIPATLPGTVGGRMIPIRDNIPTARPPVVTYALIAANVLVYFFWQRGGLSLGDPSNLHYQCQVLEWSAVPYELTHNTALELPSQCGIDNAPT